jgi:hypothetical protein
MQTQVARWEAQSDPRSIFLSCYQMMTRNMLAAIERCEFDDPAWVGRLLERFAGYYFIALETYDRDPASAPAVWQQAHASARDAKLLALQKLLLGVNAHINYDLVLTLAEVLEPEWAGLSAPRRGERYADHCRVNAVIARTIDAVQDQVLEPAMPGLALVDNLLGRLDEQAISGLIARWRDSVWRHATSLLETGAPDRRALLIQQVEDEALRRARAIALTDLRALLSEVM